MSRPRLPDGFQVRLRPGLTRLDEDRVVVGGSPLRALRLTDRARALLPRAGTSAVVEVRDPASAGLAGRLLDGNLADPVLRSGLVEADELTVVIPVRDRAAQLDAALSAVAGLRVVVVDDASRDPGAVAAVVRRHGAEVVALPVNVGPAGARNAGRRTW